MKPAPDSWIYSPDPSVDAAVSDIFARYPARLRSGLSPLLSVLRALGDPQLSLPPVIHAAGTNGKGSTLAFVQSILAAAGLRVHKFTSPHLVRIEERFVVNGEMMAATQLLPLIAEVDLAAKDSGISFFEFFTAVFFLAAARYPADAVLLETGLGGLMDSTNVVPSCAVAVITRLSLDHTHILGDTLTDIALQKAGIIKQGCPVVAAPQDTAAAEVIAQTAARLSAPLAAWRVTPAEKGFVYDSARHSFELPLPALSGAHQVLNAGAAIAALEQTVFDVLLSEEIVARGLQQVDWPGRWQRLKTGKLADLLPAGWELWLDGAHNDSGAEALAAELARRDDGRPLHLVTAFKGQKDPVAFYGPILPRMTSVRIVAGDFLSDMPGVPMVPPEKLAADLETLCRVPVRVVQNMADAVQSCVFSSTAPARILVTGSLYLVGHALKVNG